jgi:hypothetical protein
LHQKGQDQKETKKTWNSEITAIILATPDLIAFNFNYTLPSEHCPTAVHSFWLS